MAKVQKKLAKVAKQLKAGSLSTEEARDEQTRLKKKISKWEKAVAAAAAAAGNGREQQEQVARKKRGHDDGGSQEGDGAANGGAGNGGLSKKQKKVAAAAAAQAGGDAANGSSHHHHHHHSKHHRKHAVVGDAKLAAAGKPIIKSLYAEHPEVAALTTEEVVGLRSERETTVEGFGPDDDFVAGEIRPRVARLLDMWPCVDVLRVWAD